MRLFAFVVAEAENEIEKIFGELHFTVHQIFVYRDFHFWQSTGMTYKFDMGKLKFWNFCRDEKAIK